MSIDKANDLIKEFRENQNELESTYKMIHDFHITLFKKHGKKKIMTIPELKKCAMAINDLKYTIREHNLRIEAKRMGIEEHICDVKEILNS